eukprot:113011_1
MRSLQPNGESYIKPLSQYPTLPVNRVGNQIAIPRTITDRRNIGRNDENKEDRQHCGDITKLFKYRNAPVRTHAALQQHSTLVKTEGGRLKKDCAPIEAITEYIGDYAMYRELMTRLPNEYTAVLSAMTNQRDLQISHSSYVAMTYVLPSFADFGPQHASPTEQRHQPIQTVLEYSRPFFEAEPYKQSKITLDLFPMSNLCAIAIIAWLDMYSMNIDRFRIPHQPKTTEYQKYDAV